MSNILSFYCPTKIYMGIDAHRKVEQLIKEWKIHKFFLVVDHAILKTEIYSLVGDILSDNKVIFEIYTDIEPDPGTATVEKAYEVYQKSGASALLAIGGGSTMDVGKAVGILATNGGRIQQYEGIEKFSIPPLPLIAIPTTAGTGSEVSGSCVITDSDRGLKMSIRHASLNPAKIAILDPIALKSLPAGVAAHSAMDAFVHAFESYIALNATPMTDGINLYAIELISQNVRPFVANRANLEAGFNMACASNLAGITFGLTGLGNVHCMARFVGAFFHVSHGLSNAICLPYAAAFNLIANPRKYARVALAMGEHIQGMTELEAACKAIDAIRRLCKDLGIPEKLREINASEDKLSEMARLCVEAGYNRWNPRHSTYDDFLNLFKKAF
jgi:alcohol dehydrogenase